MKLKHWFLHLTFQLGRYRGKKKGKLIGQKFAVPRNGKRSVQTFLYRPGRPVAQPIPVMFNVHGGGWVGCDATGLDTQSQTLADKLGCFVVNINYTKLDAKPFPYPQEEIRDTVLYFRDHAAEYGIDTTRFSLIGYSAGGHLCAGTALLLRDCGFDLNSQFLCYPFLNFTAFFGGDQGVSTEELDKAAKLMNEIFFAKMDKSEPLLSPGGAKPEALQGLAPAEILTCGEDWLFSHATQYEALLQQAGVEAVRKDFVGSIHGFLEVNFPETKGENGAKSPEQEAFMKEAMEYICQRAHYYWRIS